VEDEVHFNRGVLWRRAGPFFFQPSLPLEPVDSSISWPSPIRSLAGFTHLSALDSESNGVYPAIVVKNLRNYSPRSLPVGRRTGVRKGLSQIRVRPVEPKRLIVTAEDYGITEETNLAIRECALVGNVTSIDVMTTMSSSGSIKSLLDECPDVAVGIHWNISQGKALCELSTIRSLVDSSGEFLDNGLGARLRLGRIDPEHIRRELFQQYYRLAELHERIVYWTSHQAVHFTLFSLPVFVSVARELGIQATRNQRTLLLRDRLPSLKESPRLARKIAQNVVLRAVNAYIIANGFDMPSGLLTAMGRCDDGSRTLPLIETSTWRGAAELSIHPATCVANLEGKTYLLESRVNEWRTFKDPLLRSRLQKNGIELVRMDECANKTPAK
jgi:predicted glycoside hydrolase/deacetylase ChbG (UPF0249 family)